MLSLIYLAILLALLWPVYKFIQYSIRAITNPDQRTENIFRAIGALLALALLTYPLVLGPVVANIACSSGVGLKVKSRVDLRSEGYLVDWPGGHGEYLQQPVADLLLKRVAFFETSSFLHDGSIQHFSLQRDDSRDCINPESFLGEWQPPAGLCLAMRRTRPAESKYLIRTSSNYWRPDSFQRSLALVERGKDDVTASYTLRRIPMANMGFVAGFSSAVECGADGLRPPWYSLTDGALIANEREAVKLDRADPPRCELPTLPENVEVHHYKSEGGSRRIDVALGAGNSWPTESDVYVNRPGVPVVLWLANREPVLWRIRQTPGSQIFAVIVTGYESVAAVTGVKASVPLLISSKNYARMSNCHGDQAVNQLTKLHLPLSSDITGDKNYASGREVIPFVIGPKLKESEYEESDEIPESRYALVK